jgi:nitrate reductase NapE component
MFHPRVGWYHVSPRGGMVSCFTQEGGMVSCFPKGGMVSRFTQGLDGAKSPKNDCISCVSASVASVYDSCADCNRSWVHRWSCFDVIELLLLGLFVVPVVSVILRGIYVFCLFMVGCASLCGWWGMRMGGGGCYRVARWKTVIRSCSMFSLLSLSGGA